MNYSIRKQKYKYVVILKKFCSVIGNYSVFPMTQALTEQLFLNKVE